MEVLYIVSCVVLALGSVYMIFATCYDDGIIGKLGLGLLLLGSASVIYKSAADIQQVLVPNSVVLIVAGSAAFMLRHLLRFWAHQHREKKHDRRPAF